MYQHIKDHSQTYSQRPGGCECKIKHKKIAPISWNDLGMIWE